MSNNIYVYKWSGVNTGWDYKLHIYGASLEPITDTPNYIDLPPGVIDVTGVDMEYDKYPLGGLAMPELELNVYLDDIPDNIPLEFFDIMLVPPMRIELRNPGLASIETGTVIEMYIKHNGNYADDSIPEYKIFMIGIHRAESNMPEPESSLLLKVKALDIRKVIFESFTFHNLVTWYGDNDKTRYCCIEAIAKDMNGVKYAIGHAGYNYKYIYQSLDTIHNYLTVMGSKCGEMITRGRYKTWIVESGSSAYHKQLYDGSGGLGEGIPTSDLYCLMSVQNLDTMLTPCGLAVNDDENSLLRRYQNSVWDYFKDYAEDGLYKMILPTFSTIAFIPIFGMYVTESKVTIKDKTEFNTLKGTLYTDILKTATTSQYEFGDEEVGEYTVTANGTKAQIEYTNPIIYNNIPVLTNYIESNNEPFHLQGNCRSLVGNGENGVPLPHALNLYYFDRPDIFTTDIPDQAIRVHEYCNFQLGYGLYTNSIKACEFVPWQINKYLLTSENMKRHLTELHFNNEIAGGYATNSGCKPQILARAMIGIFSNPKTSVIEFSVDISEHTQFAAGGAIGLPWWNLATEIEMNMQTIHSYFKFEFNKWYITSVKFDFEKEVATIKAILRTI